MAEWTRAERRWALEHLVIHDRQAGLVAAGSWDAWRFDSVAERSQSPGELLIDARSQAYVRLIPAPESAWALRVVTEGDDGRRLAISHWNKFHKGAIARALVRDRPRVRTIGGLRAWAHRAGIRLERVGVHDLDLVV